MHVPWQARPRGRRQTFEVTLPRNLPYDAVLNLMRALSGPLRAGLHPRPTIAMELYADARGFSFHLNLPEALTLAVESLVLTHLAGATITPISEADDRLLSTEWHRVIEIGATSPHESLRLPVPAAAVASLLSAFTGLGPGQALAQQWVVTGTRPTSPVRRDEPRTWLRPAIDSRADQRKHEDPMFLAVGRIAARGGTPVELLSRLRDPYASLGTYGVQVRRRRTSSRAALTRLQQRAAVTVFPAAINAAELAVVSGLPFGRPNVPGLRTTHSRHLVADHTIPSQGLVIGMSNFPRDERPLAISAEDRTAHTLLVGPTGCGKSTLIENLIAADIMAGMGLVYVDPKGDSVGRVLDAIPPERLADVVLFDVTDVDRPTGFNVLSGQRPDRVAGQLMLVFDKLFGLTANTPRAYDVLRNTLMTLAQCGYTVIEVPLAVLPGPRGQAFRDVLTPQLQNPELLDFWLWFNNLSAREQAETGAPITRRLRPMLLYPELRSTFGQVKSGIDLKGALAQRKIVLVPLSSAQLHEEANVVGTLFLNELWNVVQTTERSEDFALYVDEFKDVMNLAVSFGDVLAKARGHRLPITVATQDVSRLTEGMRRDVMNNTRTKILFQPAASDLPYLRPELGDWATESDLANLGPREILTRIHVGGASTPPATGRTLPPPEPVGLGQAARSGSRTRYGRPRAEVEAEIDQRLKTATRCATRPSGDDSGQEPTFDEPIGWEEWDV